MTIYCADVDWNLPEEKQEAPQPFGQRKYCNNCRRREISLPHNGTDEILILGELVEDGSDNLFKQEGAIDASGPSSGVEWDPLDIFNTYLPPLDDSVVDKYSNRHILGPATVYDELLYFGIRLETFVENGILSIPDRNKHQIKHIIKDMNERRQDRRFIFQDFQRLGPE
jgi:hypothetical protein